MDMRSFILNTTFDAIVSMFAVFNHNLSVPDAKDTLSRIKQHMKPHSIAIVDLYNPQGSGEKIDVAGSVSRKMQWQFQPGDELCMTTLTFSKESYSKSAQFPLRIFPFHSLESLFLEAGFRNVALYENYTFERANSSSKNIIAIAR
jgi:hypothetical protein